MSLGLVSGAVLGLQPVAWGIPGQSPDQAAAWVRDNPVLRPRPGETLNINRVDPDGSRFTFLASVAPPGRIINPLDRETIRSERMTFFRPQGLTPEDLFQAIRDIYGPEIAADLDQAVEVIRYPAPEALAGNQTYSLSRAIQGVVLQGNQLAYWLELTQNPDGRVQQGQVWVFQPEWLTKVEGELAERYPLQVLTR
ncbi:hypothetical protein JX360_00620 [Synechococcus bigranulatus str. 'Rupite']|uniref:Uncharacterized protein n=2 Tax=Thermostichus vulcanus TaxID=32053 RepID=A0ABT0C6J7_THEVL|nr:hypothetical protein [Thermostichus vulcanus str. 'Rupite']